MAETDEETLRRRYERKKRIAKDRAQREAMTESVNKAATARQHKRPPPLVRKNTARASALEMLSSFMEISINILHESLHAVRYDAKGNVMKNDEGQELPDLKTRRTAANYIIEKVAGAEGTYLPEGMGIVVDDRDVMATADKVMELVMNGQLSIEAGQKLFGLLEKQAALYGLSELDELRKMVEQLSGAGARTIDGESVDNHPVWLRLGRKEDKA